MAVTGADGGSWITGVSIEAGSFGIAISAQASGSTAGAAAA